MQPISVIILTDVLAVTAARITVTAVSTCLSIVMPQVMNMITQIISMGATVAAVMNISHTKMNVSASMSTMTRIACMNTNTMLITMKISAIADMTIPDMNMFMLTPTKILAIVDMTMARMSIIMLSGIRRIVSVSAAILMRIIATYVAKVLLTVPALCLMQIN